MEQHGRGGITTGREGITTGREGITTGMEGLGSEGKGSEQNVRDGQGLANNGRARHGRNMMERVNK